IKGLRVPDNVTIEYDLSLDDFLQRMRQSYIVVIPLKEPEKPTGQLVLLQAMGMGKATIISDGEGVPSYIRNGVEAILVDVGNVSALREAILSVIKDTELYSKLSHSAIQAFRENHSVSKFILLLQQLIN
ncbi:MAG: glycosyltransferase, partial [Dehalococcoidia bacterium]|nr:glycosyltransferase [Dehalococcoidia bacterium]